MYYCVFVSSIASSARAVVVVSVSCRITEVIGDLRRVVRMIEKAIFIRGGFMAARSLLVVCFKAVERKKEEDCFDKKS